VSPLINPSLFLAAAKVFHKKKSTSENYIKRGEINKIHSFFWGGGGWGPSKYPFSIL